LVYTKDMGKIGFANLDSWHESISFFYINRVSENTFINLSTIGDLCF